MDGYQITEVNTKDHSANLDELVQLIAMFLFEFESPLPIYSKPRIRTDLLLFNRKSHYWKYFLLRKDGKAIGYIKYSINLLQDKHMSTIQTYLLPDHRKQELSKMLLTHCMQTIPDTVDTIEFFMRKELDESKMIFHDLVISLHGKLTYLELVNVAHIEHYYSFEMRQKYQKMIQPAKDKGYHLEFYENGSYLTDQKFDIDAYIAVLEGISNDMPREEASWEDETWDVDRLKARYEYSAQKAEHFWTFIAMHSVSNKPVGMTEVIIQDTRPIMIEQMETGVIREHRGNKLGLLLKFAMLDRILEHPQAREAKFWKTENAASNTHMLEINSQLGFRPMYQQAVYEVPRKHIKVWLNCV